MFCCILNMTYSSRTCHLIKWLCVVMCGYVRAWVVMCRYVWVCVILCGYVGTCEYVWCVLFTFRTCWAVNANNNGVLCNNCYIQNIETLWKQTFFRIHTSVYAPVLHIGKEQAKYKTSITDPTNTALLNELVVLLGYRFKLPLAGIGRFVFNIEMFNKIIVKNIGFIFSCLILR